MTSRDRRKPLWRRPVRGTYPLLGVEPTVPGLVDSGFLAVQIRRMALRDRKVRPFLRHTRIPLHERATFTAHLIVITQLVDGFWHHRETHIASFDPASISPTLVGAWVTTNVWPGFLEENPSAVPSDLRASYIEMSSFVL